MSQHVVSELGLEKIHTQVALRALLGHSWAFRTSLPVVLSGQIVTFKI